MITFREKYFPLRERGMIFASRHDGCDRAEGEQKDLPLESQEHDSLNWWTEIRLTGVSRTRDPFSSPFTHKTFRSTLNYVKERNFSPLNTRSPAICCRRHVLCRGQSVSHSGPDSCHSLIHSGDHSLQLYTVVLLSPSVFGAETLLLCLVCDSSQTVCMKHLLGSEERKIESCLNVCSVSLQQVLQLLLSLLLLLLLL